MIEPRKYDKETVQQALKMHADGLMPSAIGASLCASPRTVRWWIDTEAARQSDPVPVVRVKRKSGSGVIAPPAYRYGYASWGRGHRW